MEGGILLGTSQAGLEISTSLRSHISELREQIWIFFAVLESATSAVSSF